MRVMFAFVVVGSAAMAVIEMLARARDRIVPDLRVMAEFLIDWKSVPVSSRHGLPAIGRARRVASVPGRIDCRKLLTATTSASSA